MTKKDREDVMKINAALKEKLLQLMDKPGNYQTSVENLMLSRRDSADCSEKCFEKPLAAIVVQGNKRSFFGTREYHYSENQCLVAGVDMPSFFGAMDASPEKPFLSLSLYLDRKLITELSMDMAQETRAKDIECQGVAVADATPDLLEGFLRLMTLLDKPEQISIRAPLVIRELHYLLLLSPHGGILRQLNTLGTQNNQVVRAIAWLRQNLTRPVRVETLAHEVNMSTSSLHRHFKSITGYSPLQYHKQLRLYEAQRLMLTENERAANAALAVGYESVTQFNREYKRLFGEPPHRDISRRRESVF